MNETSPLPKPWTLHLIPWGMLSFIILLTAGYGILLISGNLAPIWTLAYLALIGFLLFFTEINRLSYQPDTRQIDIRRYRIWRFRSEQFRLDDVNTICVELSRSIESSGPSYRVTFILENGERIPLTSVSHPGRRRRENQARKICEQLSARRYSPIHLALDGIVTIEKSGNTHSIPWKVEIVYNNGLVPLTRWHAPCRDFTGGFLLLIPASSDYQGTLPDGMPGKIVRRLYDSYLKVLGVQIEQLPDFEKTHILQVSRDSGKTPFTMLSSDVSEARRWMDASRIHHLTSWMKSKTPAQENAGCQPHILLTANTLRMAFRASFYQNEDIQDIARLGVALIG